MDSFLHINCYYRNIRLRVYLVLAQQWELSAVAHRGKCALTAPPEDIKCQNVAPIPSLGSIV